MNTKEARPMLSLTAPTVMRVLRALSGLCDASRNDTLPSVGTPERVALSQRVQQLFGLSDTSLMPDTALMLQEWATTISDAAEVVELKLFDLVATGAFSQQLQQQYRHEADALRQEARALAALMGDDAHGERTLVSWLAYQTVPGFMLGALLPQVAGWRNRNLFDHANALWELKAGDVLVTHKEGWRALAQRLPSLPVDITAVVTEPLDRDTYRTLIAKGVAQVIELYITPETGVLAYRRSPKAPFELLSHWHPTESENYLLQLVDGRPREVHLAEPLHWVGGRHFVFSAPVAPAPEPARVA